jgi:glycopeptide antibiotics resistance protein
MKTKRTRWLAACVLIAYSAILIKFVVFKAIPTIRVGHLRFRIAGPHTGPGNFVPFTTIVPQLMGRGHPLIDLVNLIGNILPFMPIGLLAPLVFRSVSWRKALVLGVLAGLTCEVMEVVFRVGIFDVDDVILNAVGVVAGFAVFALFKRLAQPRQGEDLQSR